MGYFTVIFVLIRKKYSDFSPCNPRDVKQPKAKLCHNAELTTTRQERKAKYASGVEAYVLESIRLLQGRKRNHEIKN